MATITPRRERAPRSAGQGDESQPPPPRPLCPLTTTLSALPHDVLELVAARLPPVDAASLALACRAGRTAAAAVTPQLAVPAAALFGGGSGDDKAAAVSVVAPWGAAVASSPPPRDAMAAPSPLPHHHHHHPSHHGRKRGGPLPAPEPLSGGGARRRLAGGAGGAGDPSSCCRRQLPSPCHLNSSRPHVLLKYYALERLVVRGCGGARCPLTAAALGAGQGCCAGGGNGCGGGGADAHNNANNTIGGLAAAFAAAGRLQPTLRHAANSPLYATQWPPAPPPAGVLVLGTGASGKRAAARGGGGASGSSGHPPSRGALASSCDNSSSEEEVEDYEDDDHAMAGPSSRGAGSSGGSNSSSVCAMSVDGGSAGGASDDMATCLEDEEDDAESEEQQQEQIPARPLPMSFLPSLKALRVLDLGTAACAAAVRRMATVATAGPSSGGIANGPTDIVHAIGTSRLPHLQRLVLPAALWSSSPGPSSSSLAPQLAPLTLLPALDSLAFVGAPASADLARLLGQLSGGTGTTTPLRSLAFDASAFAPAGVAAPAVVPPVAAVAAPFAAACAAAPAPPPQDELFLGRCLAQLPPGLESLALANLRTVNGAVFASLAAAVALQGKPRPGGSLSLRHLELPGCAALAPRALGALAASPWGPRLERLRLGGCVEMASPTRAALPARELGRMARLEELVMLAAAAAPGPAALPAAAPSPATATAATTTTCPCGCGEGGDGLAGVELHVHDLPALAALPALRRLRVGGLHACVTAASVVAAARAAPLGAPLARLEALAADDVCALSESLWYPQQQQVQQQQGQQQGQQQQQQQPHHQAPAPTTANPATTTTSLPVGVLAALCPALRSLSVRRAEGVAVALRAAARHPSLETLLLGGGGRADGWCGGRLFAGDDEGGEATTAAADAGPAADAAWAYDDGRTWWGGSAFTANGGLRAPSSAAAAASIAATPATPAAPVGAAAPQVPLLQPAVWAWLITLPKLDTVVVHSADRLVAPMPPSQPLFAAAAAAPDGLLAAPLAAPPVTTTVATAATAVCPPSPCSREPLMLFTALGRARRVALLSWKGADDASLWSASRLLRGCSELVVAGAAGLTDAGLALLGETAAQPQPLLLPPTMVPTTTQDAAAATPTTTTATRRLRLVRCPGVTDAGVRALVAVARTLAASSAAAAAGVASASAASSSCGCHQAAAAPLPPNANANANAATRRRPSLLLDLIECGPRGPSPMPSPPPLLLSPMITGTGGTGGGVQGPRRRVSV